MAPNHSHTLVEAVSAGKLDILEQLLAGEKDFTAKII